MTDVAALGLSVDSDGVVRGADALDKFAASSDRASGAADRVSNSTKKASSSASSMASSVSDAQARTAALAASMANAGNGAANAASQFRSAGSSAIRMAEGYDVLTGKMNSNFLAIGRNLQGIGAVPNEFREVSGAIEVTAADTLNLTRQLADVGVTAAMGMNPFMIALQQLPQIFDILQMIATRAETTIAAALKAMAVEAWAAIAPFLPLIAAITAAIAAMAAVFGLATRAINKGNEDIIGGLGLTEKQLKRVEKAGISTSVTLGDTFSAFAQIAGERIVGALEGPLKWLSDAWTASMDFITEYGALTIKYIIGAFVGAYSAIKAAWGLLPAAIANIMLSATNMVLKAAEDMVNRWIDRINTVLNFANAAANMLGMEGLGTIDRVDFGQLANPFAGASSDLAEAVSTGFAEGLAQGVAAVDRFFADVAKRARELREKALLDAAGDAEKAAKKAAGGGKTEAEKYTDLIDAMAREIAMTEAKTKAVGMSAEAALRLENQQKALNDAQAKGIALTDAQKTALLDLADKLTDAQIALAKAEAMNNVQKSFDEQIKSISIAMQSVGLYGQALNELTIYQGLLATATENGKFAIDAMTDAQLRSKAATIAQGQAVVDNLKFMEDFKLSHDAAIKALDDQSKALGMSGAELYAFQYKQEALNRAIAAHVTLTDADIKKIEEAAKAYGEQKDAIDKTAASLNALNSILGQGPLGDFFKVLTSKDPVSSLLGMGGIGTLIGLMTGQGQKAYKEQRKAIEDGLVAVFGKNASGLASQLAGVIQGAGLGSMAAETILGKQGTAGNIGSAIGGAAGQVLGNMIAGPIGGMIGSVVLGTIGGAIGGLISGPAKGSVTISNGAIVAGRGKDAEMLANANQAAGSIVDSLDRVAEALGGTLNMGAGTVSIGQRKGNWVVDIFGRGNTTGPGVINFGADSEAAIAYAMKDLINDGVLTGLRASTMNLLKAGTDFNAQLEKAVAFEEVLAAAKDAASPFASQLEALSAQFKQLTAIFAEANATAEEYASLQAYISQQQQALIDQASSAYRSTFNTDAENVAYAQQQISATLTPMGYGNITTVAQYKALVAATDALANPELYGALMNLADEFGVLKDASDNAAAAAQAQAEAEKAKAEAIASQKASMQVELLRAQGKESEALALQRQNELAAMDESLRGLQRQIYQWQDIADARDVLRTAYDRESASLQTTIDKLKGLGDTLREFRDSLTETGGGANSLASLAAKFREIGRMAMLGDQTAMGNLPDAAQSYLDAALANATSATDYQRAVAEVKRYTDGAIGAADQGVSVAEQQLEQLKTSVGALIDINDNIVSVAEAIERLTALQSGVGGTPATPGGTTNSGGSVEDMLDRVEERRRSRDEERQRRMDERLDRMNAKQEELNRILGRVIGADGLSLRVSTDPLEPLNVAP